MTLWETVKVWWFNWIALNAISRHIAFSTQLGVLILASWRQDNYVTNPMVSSLKCLSEVSFSGSRMQSNSISIALSSCDLNPPSGTTKIESSGWLGWTARCEISWRHQIGCCFAGSEPEEMVVSRFTVNATPLSPSSFISISLLLLLNNVEDNRR